MFRSSQESPQTSNRKRSSPRGRHSDQEEHKTSTIVEKNDDGKDAGREAIEDNQAEQRTDRFKSERFDSNDNANDSKSKDRRNSEGERRGGGRGYRGRGPSQQEWRDSNKLQESLSDPTHVPRLGQFFEVGVHYSYFRLSKAFAFTSGGWWNYISKRDVTHVFSSDILEV